MSYTIGQRLGRLTVTRLEHGRVAVQVRCDCGTGIATWLEFDFLAPPDEIGEYHARWLLAAEAGRLRYDASRYRIHGVPNNAADARDRGLLVDADDGPVLTELGGHMLAHWKANQPDEPPPFTLERAAWIRENAWTGALRREDDGVTVCPCQYGQCTHCEHEQHKNCVNKKGYPKRRVAGRVCGPDGVTPLAFREPYEHETDAFATGPRYERVAMVWLADRVCRWVCPCDCRNALSPREAVPAAEDQPVRVTASAESAVSPKPLQLDLWEAT
ncbi:hypothetical protein E1287_25725 [Actinomadura sp. KC06]|uniref:DUF6248 family natural product biosynthesis protein n=1 Tax=Actinomadura sp. KC06 TaxID=2530369 RepID=UPI001051FB37|nr:DUF6248 family natural product biosynthesis protein [Actinomadura sp. KC06]TDD31663.1 hypothetical protein E1287_25725 [Actinomadura sp. KC06]